MRVGGVVLCGGRSSRMGTPKAWLPFDGEFLLPRVVRVLSEVVSPVVVVAAVGQDLPPLPPGVPVVRDDAPDRGPLQGLLAGFRALQSVADAAYVSACDVPLLRPAFVRRVVDSLGAADAAGPELDGFVHPLAAVYRVGPALATADRLLAAGRFAARDLFAALAGTRIGAESLAAVDPALDSLRGANTPGELARLRRPGDG